MFNKADYLAIYEEFEDKGIFQDDIEIGSFPGITTSKFEPLSVISIFVA